MDRLPLPCTVLRNRNVVQGWRHTPSAPILICRPGGTGHAPPKQRQPLSRCSAQRGKASGGRASSAWAWPLSWRGEGSTGAKPEQQQHGPPLAVKTPGSTESPPQTVDSTHARSGNGSGAPALTPQPPPGGNNGSPKADSVITFAYGANLNFMTLAKREVRVLSRDPAFVVDPAVRLVFKHQGGYATLEQAEPAGGAEAQQAEPRFRPYDGRVHGVLYRVTREDFDKLAKREGGYLVQELQVQTYDGVQHAALVFVSNPLFKLPQEVNPTEQYLAKVREGAADNYLEPSYQAFLSGITTVPGTGLGAEYYNTPSKYMGYSFLVVVALITVAFFFQH